MALPLFRCTACRSLFSFISRNNGCSRPCVYAVCVSLVVCLHVCVSFSRSEYPLRHFAFLSHFASLLPLRTAQPKPPTPYFPSRHLLLLLVLLPCTPSFSTQKTLDSYPGATRHCYGYEISIFPFISACPPRILHCDTMRRWRRMIRLGNKVSGKKNIAETLRGGTMRDEARRCKVRREDA